MKVFHGHRVIAEHPEAVHLTTDGNGRLHLFNARREVIKTYEDGEWHGAGTIPCAGPPEDAPDCEACCGH